jgi:hypothetical protein
MKHLSLVGLTLACTLLGHAHASPAPASVVKLANSTLAALGQDSVVVKAVNHANAKGTSLQAIQTIDKEWIAAKKAGKKLPIMNEMLSNDCAKHLNQIMAKHGYITEIFVTDNQGANVCQTGMTGDYWQGDEAKFQKVFNKGVLVSEVEKDDGMNVSQVSVPVADGKRHVGTMTIGVNVDKVK